MNLFYNGILLVLFLISLSEGYFIPHKINNGNIRNIPSPRDTGGKIKELLEQFRNRMCHEIPSKNIPKLDPFGIDKLEFSVEQELAELDVKLINLSAVGLAKFDFPKLKFLPNLEIDIHMVLPKIVLTNDYKINGTVKDLFDLDGNGDMRLEIYGIELIFKARIKYSGGAFSFTIQKLEPTINQIKFRINKLFPDDELNDFISDMVSDLALGFLNDLWQQYGKDVQDIIEMFVMDKIKDLTLKDLMEFLRNLGNIFDENDPEPNCKFDDF